MTSNNNVPIARTSQEKMIYELLTALKRGEVRLETPNGQSYFFRGRFDGAKAHIKISDWKVVDAIFTKGDVGFGEAYRDGLWDSEEISQLILLAIQNEDVFKKVIVGNGLKLLPYIVKHKLNRNTLNGSKRNIQAHYDLGNDFYKLWLDPTMTYSSALFKKGNESLEEAQKLKNQNIIKFLSQYKFDGAPNFLEIGCGWGGFMAEAQNSMGANVFGLTLSKEQKKHVENNNRGKVFLEDYRDHAGLYDGVVSIEMFEALGMEYWTIYFEKVSSLLKPGAPAIIQTITMNDQDFPSYSRGTDFIQQYIFPGGMLPSVDRFTKKARQAGLRLMNAESFGLSYAKTLNIWESEFSKKEKEVRDLGFDSEFIRLWRFYLKYCEGAFLSGKTNVYQFQLEKI